MLVNSEVKTASSLKDPSQSCTQVTSRKEQGEAGSMTTIGNRQEAVVITAKEDISYADILRRVDADPTLKDLRDNVTQIRRTQKEGLLSELSKEKKDHDGTMASSCLHQGVWKTGISGKAAVWASSNRALQQVRKRREHDFVRVKIDDLYIYRC